MVDEMADALSQRKLPAPILQLWDYWDVLYHIFFKIMTCQLFRPRLFCQNVDARQGFI